MKLFSNDKTNKSNKKKRKFLPLLLILFVAIGIGCSSNSSENDDKSKKVDTVDTKEDDKEKEVYNIGDEVKFNDTTLKVNSIKKSNGNEFDKPKKGREFVIVNLTIKNNSNSNIAYNPFDFKLQNSKGQLTDDAFTTIDSDTSLEAGELTPNGSVSGTISFEAPKNDKNLVLQFNNNLFSDECIKIKLN